MILSMLGKNLRSDTGADNAYMLYVIKNGEAFNNGKADRNDVGVESN